MKENTINKSLICFLLIALAAPGCLPYLRTPSDTQAVQTRSGGQARSYLLYVPKTYAPDKPSPLVITIHGFGQWPAHQLWLSGWNQLADEKGVIVAYPSGTGLPKRWTMRGRSGAKFDPEPDVAFIRKMIAEIARDYRIDPSRIYVNGLSNGGGMTYILACEMANVVAAVGVVAGGFHEPSGGCHPSRPVPVIAFHGTADDIVPYEGGELLMSPMPFSGITDWVAAWGRRDGCAPQPVTATVSPSVYSTTYQRCDAGAEVTLYTIEGGGHTWPGGEEIPEVIGGKTTHEIDATQLMWKFFERHALTSTR